MLLLTCACGPRLRLFLGLGVRMGSRLRDPMVYSCCGYRLWSLAFLRSCCSSLSRQTFSAFLEDRPRPFRNIRIVLTPFLPWWDGCCGGLLLELGLNLCL